VFYVPYVQIVGEHGFKETRSALVRNHARLPDGNYGFLELYCGDPTCDCRRVLIQVLREDSADRVWATINYGFATLEYYGVWVGDPSVAVHLAELSLEPTGCQSPFAPALLELFRNLLDAPEYAARLERHYDEVKRLTSRVSDKRRDDSLWQSKSKATRKSRRRRSSGA
jgi:hypothetical protein